MRTSLIFINLILLIFLLGCSDAIGYKDDEVAAIVKGEEITIGELRFLYPDEQVLEMIEGAIKIELVIQEMEKMNIDVTEEVKGMVEVWSELPPEDVNNSGLKHMREFAESQAEKLGMNPEEYHKKYVEKNAEIGAYMNAYIKRMLGEPEENLEEFNEKVNQLLNSLVEANEDEIKILIK